MAETVEHIIKTGLIHGSKVAVYVTQSNSKGVESEKSDVVMKVVGDITPPSVPILRIDNDFGYLGFRRNFGNVDVGFAWTEPPESDLDSYRWFLFENIESLPYMGPKEYPSLVLVDAKMTGTFKKGCNSAFQTGFVDGKAYHAGIQAVDTSGNTSDVWIISFVAHDESIPDRPEGTPVVESQVWGFRITVNCIIDPDLISLNFYRDGTTLVGSVPFVSGKPVIFVDTLNPKTDTRTHRFSYAYVDATGTESPRSELSDPVEASLSPMTTLDKEELELAFELFDIKRGSSVPELVKALEDAQIKIRENAASILHATKSIDDVYDKYTILAKEFKLISSENVYLKGQMDLFQTELKQNSKEIILSAVDQQVTPLVHEVQTALGSAIKVQADKIVSMVEALNTPAAKGSDGTYKHSFSTIAQTADHLELKVDNNAIIAAMNFNNQGDIQIDGRHLRITTGTTFDGMVEFKGKVTAKNFVIENSDGTVAFGGRENDWKNIPLIQTGGMGIGGWGFPGGRETTITRQYFDIPGPGSRNATLFVFLKCRASQGHYLDTWFHADSGAMSNVGQIYQQVGSDVTQITILAQQFTDTPHGRYWLEIHGISDATWWADGFAYQLFM